MLTGKHLRVQKAPFFSFKKLLFFLNLSSRFSMFRGKYHNAIFHVSKTPHMVLKNLNKSCDKSTLLPNVHAGISLLLRSHGTSRISGCNDCLNSHPFRWLSFECDLRLEKKPSRILFTSTLTFAIQKWLEKEI